ncbi:hypothetical protein EBN03_12395 [Nocardia stercoris]|uniref:Uncharacterized protein n=1 Tax=Nocardia stercoris TaxID=2483361 RepID=A0A3M2L6Y2_9NOCA|nr:hypothetical protein EBN03_12395 [Nocardia stercoris]
MVEPVGGEQVHPVGTEIGGGQAGGAGGAADFGLSGKHSDDLVSAFDEQSGTIHDQRIVSDQYGAKSSSHGALRLARSANVAKP